METKKRTFKQLTDNFIRYELGFRRVFDIPVLNQWFELSKSQKIEDENTKVLQKLQNTLIVRGSKWNEFELSEWFIGPVLSLIDFNTDDVALFAFHDITSIVKNYELSGRPDVMIATGIDEPIVPYFCFQEYKRQTDPDGNPQTQLLGAMIAAQALNKNSQAIYGIYVIGKVWYFVVLQEDKWCESKSYNADDEEIFEIFRILKALKEIILKMEIKVDTL